MSMQVQPNLPPVGAPTAQAAQAASKGATVAPNAIGNALAGRSASASATTAASATAASATTKTSFFTKIKNSKFGQVLGNAFSKVKTGLGKVFKSKGGKIGLGIAAAAALVAAGKFIYDKLNKSKTPTESTEPVVPVVVPEQEEATEPETPVEVIPQQWQGFIDSGKDFVCRDASGKTKNIQGKIGNLPETFTDAPAGFTITDSSSGKDHVYNYLKVGTDNEEKPIYQCIDMNGREMDDNEYTLEWVDETPVLVQYDGQANYGRGLKFKK